MPIQQKLLQLSEHIDPIGLILKIGAAHQMISSPAAPETVALYIADCASRLAVATISRRLRSITFAHQTAGHFESPARAHNTVVGETLNGIRRALGAKQKVKDALLAPDI